MKITEIRAIPYTFTMTRRIGDAHLPEGTAIGSDMAVFVDTDEGLTGVAVGYGHETEAVAAMASALVGSDPRPVRGLWERMVAVTFKAGLSGSSKLAVAALDCALWDLKAKIGGVPLWKELGALEGRVRGYASGLDTPLDDHQLRAYYTRMAAHGFDAGKLKVGHDQQSDTRRLRIVRDCLARVDRPPTLMIDANEYWTAKQAIRRIRQFEEEFDLLWVEEPAGRRDAIGLRKVSEAIRAAVATGENLDSSHDFANLIRGEAVDVVQLSYETGGITGSLRIAELAYAHNLPVTMNNAPGRHMAHLAAALPHHVMMEVLDCGRDQAFTHESRLEDGYVVLGESAGSGVVFDEDTLERFRAQRPSPQSLRRVYRRSAGSWVDV